MKLFVVGVNFRTAPVELREQLAIRPGGYDCQVCRLKVGAGLAEVVLLSTCNRVEVYAAAPPGGVNPHRVLQVLSSADLLADHVYVHQDLRAVEHLFRVASALDSMVLGETEITGQVKQAYEQARVAGLTGRILNQVFQKALQTAKQIRTQTGIGRGATSVGSAAAEIAEKIFGAGLAEHPVLILGAGQMGETCARHLAKKGARSLLVANRSPERAQALAAQIGGQAIPFEGCARQLALVDVVIASTACPTLLVTQAELKGLLPARRGRPLFLVDISVPRNIDPAVQQLDNVYLYNIDDLQAIARQNLCQRQHELAECERIIASAGAALWRKLASPGLNRPGLPVSSPWPLAGVSVPAPA